VDVFTDSSVPAVLRSSLTSIEIRGGAAATKVS